MAQHPYGQPAGPGPYWQPQPPPPPPEPRSNVGLVVVIVALAVVLLVAAVGGVVWFVRSRSATATTTQPPSAQATCTGGDTITDPQYTFKVPLGWCVDRNGSQVGMRTTSIDVISFTMVPLNASNDQPKLCDMTAEKLGPHTKRPNVAWGGRSANSYTVTSGNNAGSVLCLLDDQHQYLLVGTVGGWGAMAEVESGISDVLASWTWA
jgi:uncharacterized membrane protein